MEEKGLTERIIGAAFAVHNELGSGFLESIYEKALALELNDLGLYVEAQFPILVRYKGKELGQFYADLFIENKIIVELKAVERLAISHEVQLVHYLKATGIEVGLLLNFGSLKLEVRRKSRTYVPRPSNPVHPADPVILSYSSEEQA